MHPSFCLRAGAVLLALLLAGAGHAAERTWAGGFGPDWSTAGNWGGTGLPLAGDTVVFPNPVTSNANLAGNPAIGAIVFGSGPGGSVITGAVTINALSPTLNIDDRSTSGAANEINATVAITTATLFIKSGTVGRTLYLGRAISGSQAIRIYGPGEVEFSMANNNTYTGSTTVASADSNGGAGVLRLSGFNTQLVPGNLSIGTGSGAANSAKVKLVALFAQLIKDSANVNIAADGVLEMGTLSETIAQLTGTGSVTSTDAGAILTVGDGTDFTWGGVISGPGNVNKVGTGAMTYTAGNTYTGLTTVSRGTLALGAPVNTQTINGPLTIGVGVGTVTTATVQIANNSQIRGTATVPITINSDGALDTGSSRDLVPAVTMNGGNIAIGPGSVLRVFTDLTMNGGTINGVGELPMPPQVVATASAAFGSATINSQVSIGDSRFIVNGGSTLPALTINGALKGIETSPGIRLSGNLIKTGTGTLRLAGTAANTYGGSTTIERGVLELAKPFRVDAITGPIVIGNGADPAGAAVLKNLEGDQIGGNSTVQINASGKFDLNGFAQTIVSLSGVGTVSLPPAAWVTIRNPAGTTATYDGIISGDGQISKSNDGTQIFTRDNSYTGTTILGGGTLIINGQQTGNAFFDRGGMAGTGRIGNATLVSSGNRLRPGVPGVGGTLSTGNVSAGGSDVLVFDLTSPSVFGKLNVVGTVSLNNVALSLLPAPSFTAPIGTVFEIVTNDGNDPVGGVISPTFGGLPQGATVSAGSRNFTISYTGGSGNDITLTVAKNTSAMTLGANPNPVYPNATTTLSLAVATVGGVVPTGSVAFAINGTAVPNCSAQPLFAGVVSCFVLPSSLTAGTASVTASYSGDGNYAAGSPTPLSLVVADVTTPVLLVQVNGPSFGVVTSNPTGISCAGDCSEIYSTGTVVTLTATPNAGSVFVGWGGGCIGRISPCTLTVNSPKFATARFAPISIVGTTINIDIDGDGKYRPETDGLLITRWIRERSGPALTEGAVALPSKGGTATRVSDVDIQNYLTNIFTALDVNLSGGVTNTDSVLILRYLFGFRGAALVAGVSLPSGVTAAMVEANLLALTPVIP